MSYTAAVITVSDKGARDERIDTSGPALCAVLKDKRDEQNGRKKLPTNTATGNRKSLGRLKGAKTVAR